MTMTNPKSLLKDDERGVSPVIGIILMVAITVILAAVIGTFVLGLGDKLKGGTAPQTNFAFQASDSDSDGKIDKLTVSHDGGDTFDGKRVHILVDGTKVSKSGGVKYTSGAFSGEVTTGDSVSFEDDTNTVESALKSGTKVKVVWTAKGGKKSQVVGEFEIA